MAFWQGLLRILDTSMPTPGLFGWFHILWLAITAAAAVLLCRFAKNRQRQVVLYTAIFVMALEVYKQINYSFSYENGITYDYQWYAFPFQFCSTPMYIGLLAGLVKGKLHRALSAYLATFALFAGVCVMVYPGDVFIGTIGINIQTMICHGSMVVVGIYLLVTGYVPLEHKTVLRGAAVFAVCVAVAMVLNEIAHASGLLERETFNMFFISPYCDPSLPVYSLVQQTVPYPWCLVIYIAGFTAAAWIILLAGMGIGKLVKSKKPLRSEHYV